MQSIEPKRIIDHIKSTPVWQYKKLAFVLTTTNSEAHKFLMNDSFRLLAPFPSLMLLIEEVNAVLPFKRDDEASQ
jgi:hypothetical protein